MFSPVNEILGSAGKDRAVENLVSLQDVKTTKGRSPMHLTMAIGLYSKQ